MIVTIIIPFYNEKSLIEAVLNKVASADSAPFSKEIILVDDGSTDGSWEVISRHADDPGIQVIRHDRNLGKAAAIKSGLQSATGDIVLIQDADLEYSPEEYTKLLAPFTDGDVNVVYGSRFLTRPWPTNMKFMNLLANRIFTFLVNLLYRARITDEGTAYKLFRTDSIRSLDIECSGFEFCPEVTVKLLKQGATIVEVPISYTARNVQEGKKPGYKDGLAILWTIIRHRFRTY